MSLWTGIRRLGVVLAHVNHPNVPSPPNNWRQLVSDRFFGTGPTSLAAYINTVSYGRGTLSGEMFGPLDVQPWLSPSGGLDAAGTMNLAVRTAGLAIENPTPRNVAQRQADGLITGQTHVCVVFMNINALAHAYWGLGLNHFYPGSTVNGVCYVNDHDGLGVLAMENIHTIAQLPDLYGIPNSPGGFDVMDAASGSHPSSFSKLFLGWLRAEEVIARTALAARHDIELLSFGAQQGTVPAPRTVRVEALSNTKYFLIEARLPNDAYDGTSAISSGIPSPGAVVYEVAKQGWPPVSLRASGLINVGQVFHEPTEHLAVEILGNSATSVRVRIEPRDPTIHMLGLTFDGKMWHTIRYPTAWQQFSEVTVASGVGQFNEVDCARNGDELHVIGRTWQGGIWHTIRYPTRWQTFHDVKNASSDPGAVVDVATAMVNGELHVCVNTSNGGVWHTIRHASSWDPFNDVLAAISNPGQTIRVTAATVNGELHVCGVTATGGVWHTIRHASSWDPFGDVIAACGGFSGVMADCDIASVGGELHVTGRSVDGRLWHTIRHTNSWDSLADVKTVIGDPGMVFAISSVESGGKLHLAGSVPLMGRDRLFHTTRYATTWDSWGDVEGQAGERGRFLAVSIG